MQSVSCTNMKWFHNKSWCNFMYIFTPEYSPQKQMRCLLWNFIFVYNVFLQISTFKWCRKISFSNCMVLSIFPDLPNEELQAWGSWQSIQENNFWKISIFRQACVTVPNEQFSTHFLRMVGADSIIYLFRVHCLCLSNLLEWMDKWFYDWIGECITIPYWMRLFLVD